MYIDNLVLSMSAQEARRTVSESISYPDWPQIRGAFERLSHGKGGWLTLVGDETQLSIGNSSEGFQVCAVQADDVCLCAPPGLDEQQAYHAVKAFALGGCLTERLVWQAA